MSEARLGAAPLTIEDRRQARAGDLSPSRRTLRRFLSHRLAVLGASLIGVLAVCALLAPVLAPYNPTAIDLANISALAAADLGIARQAAELTGQGTLRQTVVYSSGGYMAVYAIGRVALMVVLGDKGLNVGRLLYESQPVIERIGSILAA